VVVGVACPDASRRGYTLGADGVLHQMDLTRGAVTASWSVSSSPPSGFCLNHEETIACFGVQNDVVVWDLAGARRLAVLEGHRQPVESVAIDADGTRCATAAKDGTIRWWDLTRMALIHTLDGHANSVGLSRDGRVLAFASPGGTLRLLATEGGVNMGTLRGHDKALADPMFDALAERLVTCSQDKTVRVWSTGGQTLQVLRGHKGGIHAVACTPDGRTAVSAGRDQTLMVWDVEQGTCLTTLSGHQAPVTAVACAPDGRLCLSGAADGTVRLWYLDFELVAWDPAVRRFRLYDWLQAFRRRRCPWSPYDPSLRLPEPAWGPDHVQRLLRDLAAVGLGGHGADGVDEALRAIK
jgi:WD40 repeat protein